MCSPFSIRSSAPTARSSAYNKHRRYFAYSSNPPHTFPRGPSKLVPFQLFEPNAQLALAHRVREDYLLILGGRSWNGTRRLSQVNGVGAEGRSKRASSRKRRGVTMWGQAQGSMSHQGRSFAAASLADGDLGVLDLAGSWEFRTAAGSGTRRR